MKNIYKLIFVFSGLFIYSSPVFSEGKSAAVKDPWCPLVIVSKSSMGPVHLKDTKKKLLKKGLVLTNSVEDKDVETADCGPLKLELVKGVVAKIWIDDLYRHVDCLTFKGKVLKTRLSGQELLNFFGGGQAKTLPETGGRIYSCSRGGVWLGTNTTPAGVAIRVSIQK